MRLPIFAGLGVCVLFVCAAAAADFQPGVKLTADGQDINVDVGHAVPCAMDWNGDGKKDLLIGNFYSYKRPIGGNVWLFLGK